MTNEFIRHDPMSRHPEQDRARIRQLYLRANRIALAVEDGVDLDAVSHRAGVGREAIVEIMHGHIHGVDEAMIRAIEDAVSGIVGDGA